MRRMARIPLAGLYQRTRDLQPPPEAGQGAGRGPGGSTLLCNLTSH